MGAYMEPQLQLEQMINRYNGVRKMYYDLAESGKGTDEQLDLLAEDMVDREMVIEATVISLAEERHLPQDVKALEKLANNDPERFLYELARGYGIKLSYYEPPACVKGGA